MQPVVFQKMMDEVCNAYGKKPSKDTIGVYWDYLCDLEDGYFKVLCQKIIRKERYFPTISVFYDHIKEDKFPDEILP